MSSPIPESRPRSSVSRNRKWRTLTRIHKWTGAVLGVQILLWFVSGLFMVMVPIERVRGGHMVSENAATLSLRPDAVSTALENYGAPATDIRAVAAGTRTFLRIDGRNGLTFYGADGEPSPPLTTEEVSAIATDRYAGSGVLEAVALLDEAPLDYRGATPIWQARFADRAGTRLYLDPRTGEVRRVRTHLWRVFDTMWMLHIMGYDDRNDFNTWWLRLAASAGLLFVLSGLGLVVHRIFLRPKRAKV